MNLYYSNKIQDSKILLDEQETIHCTRVMRQKIGDKVNITNGEGSFFSGKIIEIGKKYVVCHIEETHFTVKPPSIHIAIAPTKSIDRFEWFIEKATECGVTDITPVLSFQSERKVIKHARLKKIIISAAKQSFRPWFPVLHKLTDFENFIKQQNDLPGTHLIAHCQTEPLPHLYTKLSIGSGHTILIGPEGDFTTNEISAAKTNDFQEVALGKNRLRTETAGIVACQIISMKQELNS